MSPSPFSIYICEDSALLLDKLHADAKAATTPRQQYVFWADDGLSSAFWEHLTLQGLFAVPKLLIIRNAQNLTAETLRQLSPSLEKLAASSLVHPALCFEVNFEKGTPKIPAHIQRIPFYTLAEKNRWIITVHPLTQQNISSFIHTKALQLSLNLSSAQLAQLTQALPPDAAIIHSELAKLALMTDAENTLPDSALREISHTKELGIFELTRNLQQGNSSPTVWRQILEDKLGGDNSVFAVIALISREARILWQLLAGSTPAMPPQAIPAKKILAQSLGFSGIAKLWECTLAAEKGIKTGERSPEQAFEMLAAELFFLFKKM